MEGLEKKLCEGGRLDRAEQNLLKGRRVRKEGELLAVWRAQEDLNVCGEEVMVVVATAAAAGRGEALLDGDGEVPS